jgi:hypothetical protein
MDTARLQTDPKLRRDFITTAARRTAKIVIAKDVSRTITSVFCIACFSNTPRASALHLTAVQAIHRTSRRHPPPRVDNADSMPNDSNELTRLRAENARLIALLESHGIDWRYPPAPTAVSASPSPEPSNLSTSEKVTLVRHLFRGRTDVHPVRWESATTDKSGYAPACAHEWRAGICEKPRIKCADCGNRLLIPVSDTIIYSHLAGEKTIGIYPLLPDDTCHFLAVDFDKTEWRQDAKAFVQSCRKLDVPVALEISRSGNGAHAWIFFTTVVPARDARRLGTAIISHTCSRTRQLSLTSYDRLFPNQDTLPKGGFGNLIALPLQKKPREAGHSVFVDDDLIVHPDHLDSIRRSLEEHYLEPYVLHGRMSKKQRADLVAELDALPPDSPRILLATGRLVGEGFDHPPLDTLVLAMPVSWKGTLQQYAGRLHREHATKTDVRIIDFVDTAHPALLRMWEKRQRGYRAMGYRMAEPSS